MLYSIILSSAALATTVSAACDRAMLEEAAAAYVKAQAGGDPSLLPLADDFKYIENDAEVDIKDGVLSKAVTIDLDRSIYDTTECIAFTELSAATNSEPYVIDTRLVFTDDKITSIESIVAHEGDWAFNAAGHLRWATQEKWDPIPEAQRDTREVIQAAGDAYLDSWGDGSVSVPYGTPCARLEGGIYTGQSNANGNTCKMPEFPKPFSAGNRRYVIDEELGAVDIFNDFPFIDKTRPDGTPSTNFLRVEGGKIRYIHETTVCGTKNCGR
ncbi:unnamed protein product [Parascedosporium putredinis]|uniref:DUF8021 domain-containing protein n=1 Tax=Parascedosporium putredinis TaxID=1442378 RepID=A0A9P1HCM0_9PEZI|nr:unnamed protein product [Parascedosporium putredinis]CAI8004880.1 unnamed protein product [Parascedosporium putredinis]